jgi:hypothetical protein
MAWKSSPAANDGPSSTSTTEPGSSRKMLMSVTGVVTV